MKGKLHGYSQNEGKGLENYRSASLTSMFRGRYQNKSLKSQFKSTYRTVNVIKSSSHGSVRNKSHQNDPISFHDRIMGLADKGQALGTICLGFSTALDAIPLDTVTSKLGNLGLMEKRDGHKTSSTCSYR